MSVDVSPIPASITGTSSRPLKQVVWRAPALSVNTVAHIKQQLRYLCGSPLGGSVKGIPGVLTINDVAGGFIRVGLFTALRWQPKEGCLRYHANARSVAVQYCVMHNPVRATPTLLVC